LRRLGLLGLLLVALLLAHALLWVWGQGWLGGNPGSTQREPARLAAQQHPERWQLLAPQAASSALAPLQCREIGAYGDEAALQAAEAALLGHMKLAGGQWQRVDRSIPGQWLLASRAADNATDLERKKQALQRAGVEPLRAQSIKGESQPSWILQRFDDETAALAAQNQLRAKGLRQVRLVAMRLPAQQTWLRLPALRQDQLRLSHPTWPGGLRPCAAETAPVAPVAAAASAASTAP